LAGVELPIRAEHQAIGPAAVLLEDRDAAIHFDFVNVVPPQIGEENLALGVDSRPLAEPVAFPYDLPFLPRNQDFHQRLMRIGLRVRRDAPWIIPPQPA